MTVSDLLRRRLLVVVGKGGVGKTTVACALALEAVRHGKRALLCEVDGVSRASHLLDVPPVAIGEVSEVRPGLFLMAIEGKAALAEYLQLIIPIRRLLHTVLNSRIYQYFVAAAPGLKELMTMGKIWYEAERVDEESGKRLWDVVIMDAPATGHSLQYLRMPSAARDAFGSGLVHREAQRVVDLLTDPTRTAVNLVTTPEEMPVNETLTMYEQLRSGLKMPAGILFVNRLHSTQFTDAEMKALESRAAKTKNARELKALREVLARARQETSWSKLNARYRKRLVDEIDMPMIDLPYLFTEEFGAHEIRELAACIEASVQPRERRKGKRA